MGMNVGAPANSTKSDINVTPLIDVLLVLLIIFLVVMPIMMKSEAIEVPNELAPDQVTDIEPVVVMIRNDLAVSVDDKAVPGVDLARVLNGRLHNATQKVVFVDFEEGVPWSQVVGTMDTVRGVAPDDIHVALKLK
ncbi:MAG: biopolymer transporter ExbD [Kofleriaceae bacterium]